MTKPNVYIKPPEGYEVVDYRIPMYGETYLYKKEARSCNDNIYSAYPILEELRWRAEVDKEYFYINSRLLVVAALERCIAADSLRWIAGNYFQTEEGADAKAKEVQKLLTS